MRNLDSSAMSNLTLLEREDLISALSARLEEARSGIGSLVLLAGEAGSGKTSVTRLFKREAGERALTLMGACDPLSTPRPMSPLLDYAADEESGLQQLFDGDPENIEVFNRVLDRIRHTIRPIIMIAEDIHWADQATLDFLRFVGRRIETAKAVVLCTYRDDEVASDHPLLPVLGQLLPLPTTHRLEVPALTEAAVGQLALESTVDPAELHRVTGGNAFYVTEILAGGGTLPPTVQDAVLARVSRLDRQPRAVVEAVSIAPRSLRVDHAMHLIAASAAQVDSAVASGVIEGATNDLRFRHELARTAVEASLPPARRHTLHRKMIALLLEEDPLDHARLAHHAIHADEPHLVVEHAPSAARAASQRGAHKEAISFYEAALTQSGLIEPDEVAAIRVEMSQELRIVDRPAEALEHAEKAVDHYRDTRQREKLSTALIRVATARWSVNDRAGARDATDESIAILSSGEPSGELAYAHYSSAHFHMLSRHVQPALDDVRRALQIGTDTGDIESVWSARMVEGCIRIVGGEPAQGLATLERVLSEAEQRGDQRKVAVALGMLGSGGGEARLYERAVRYLERSIAHGLEHDEDYGVAYSRAWLARVLFEQGRWDQAIDVARLVEKTAPNPEGIAMVTALGALGRVQVRQGDSTARGTLSSVLLAEPRHELQHVWSPVCGMAELHWLSGRTREMTQVLERAYGRAMDTDSEWARGEVGYWMWKSGAMSEPPDDAAEPYTLQMQGRWRDAADVWGEIGCPYEVALSLSEGDIHAMLESLSIFDDLGAKPAATLVRSRLRSLGVEAIPRGPRHETSSNPAGLTARQLEVLGAIVDGLSNAEIADELFISKKTVEHHVSAIYSKLGVDTRTRAISTAMDLGIK